MKLSSQQIQQAPASFPKGLRIVLVYGPDAGQVSEKAHQIATAFVSDLKDPFRVARPTTGQLADPSFLYDEVAAQSLIGGRRLIWVQSPSESFAGALKKLVEDMPTTDTLLLVEAGDLDARSKLRSLADSDSSLIAAIPCYLEDAAMRQKTIVDILAQQKIKISTELAAYLTEILPSDRAAMRREVDKLALYTYGQSAVSEQDIRDAIKDAKSVDIDDLMTEIGLGHTTKAAVILDHLFSEQTASIAIIRSTQRHFLRLHMARFYVDTGLSATEAINKLTPKVFWKQVESMKRQVLRWPLPVIERFIERLEETEVLLKRSGYPEQALLAQTLLAAAARK